MSIGVALEHVAFSSSEIFKKNYLQELAYWCEGAKYKEVRGAGKYGGLTVTILSDAI